jgi:hypothetical protein
VVVAAAAAVVVGFGEAAGLVVVGDEALATDRDVDDGVERSVEVASDLVTVLDGNELDGDRRFGDGLFEANRGDNGDAVARELLGDGDGVARELLGDADDVAELVAVACDARLGGVAGSGPSVMRRSRRSATVAVPGGVAVVDAVAGDAVLLAELGIGFDTLRVGLGDESDDGALGATGSDRVGAEIDGDDDDETVFGSGSDVAIEVEPGMLVGIGGSGTCLVGGIDVTRVERGIPGESAGGLGSALTEYRLRQLDCDGDGVALALLLLVLPITRESPPK